MQPKPPRPPSPCSDWVAKPPRPPSPSSDWVAILLALPPPFPCPSPTLNPRPLISSETRGNNVIGNARCTTKGIYEDGVPSPLGDCLLSSPFLFLLLQFAVIFGDACFRCSRFVFILSLLSRYVAASVTVANVANVLNILNVFPAVSLRLFSPI